MKKLLLGLGSIAAVAAPIAAVVSCGGDKDTVTTYTNPFANANASFGIIDEDSTAQGTKGPKTAAALAEAKAQPVIDALKTLKVIGLVGKNQPGESEGRTYFSANAGLKIAVAALITDHAIHPVNEVATATGEQKLVVKHETVKYYADKRDGSKIVFGEVINEKTTRYLFTIKFPSNPFATLKADAAIKDEDSTAQGTKGPKTAAAAALAEAKAQPVIDALKTLKVIGLVGKNQAGESEGRTYFSANPSLTTAVNALITNGDIHTVHEEASKIGETALVSKSSTVKFYADKEIVHGKVVFGRVIDSTHTEYLFTVEA